MEKCVGESETNWAELCRPGTITKMFAIVGICGSDDWWLTTKK